MGQENREATRGVIDLSTVDWDNSQVDLAGEWEFYWGELYTPSELRAVTHLDFLEVPLTWNGQKTANGVELEGQGFATYRLQIVHKQANVALALLIPTTGTNAKFFIDGHEVLEIGHVATNPEEAVAEFRPQTLSFKPSGDTTELVVQVSNYNYAKGGLWHHIQIGSEHTIDDYHSRTVFFDFFLLGGLFIIGFYHLGLYFLRKKEVWNLYFAIGALVIIARLSASGHYIISFIDSAQWDLIMRMELGSFYAGIGALALYLNSIFPEIFHRKVLKFILWTSSLFTIFAITFPVLIVSYSVNFYQIFAILSLVYFVYVIMKATRNNAAGSVIFVVGFLTLTVFIVNDILLSINQIYTINLVGVGFFVFMITQAYLLAYRVIDALNRNEQLSDKLEITNRTLEKKVTQRTQELQRSIAELENTHRELEKNITELDEANKTKNTFFALIAHDLRGPLGGIMIGLGFLLDDLGDIDEKQVESRLQLMKRTTEKINLLVENLLQWSRTLQEKITLTPVSVNLQLETQHTVDLLQNQAEAKGVKLINQVLSVDTIIDKELYQTIIRNLISNSIKFTHESGKVVISSELKKDFIAISVEDNGSGMDEGTLYDLRNKIQVTSYGTKGEKGSGIGMYLVRDYIDRLGGTLEIESKLGEGSTFTFTVPLQV